MKIIGYEGTGAIPTTNITYGCAAVLQNGEIINPVLSRFDRSEKFKSKLKSVTKLQSEIELPDVLDIRDMFPMYVVDIRLDLAKREPYIIDSEMDFALFHVIATSYGSSRAYYLFESIEQVRIWFDMLCTSNYELVKSCSE